MTLGHPAESDGSGATSQAVETTGLAWGLRRSFRRYLRRAALGAENLDGGAGTLLDMRLYFPVKKVNKLDPLTLDASIHFDGGVHFYGHAGHINFRIGEFELQLSNGQGTLTTSAPGDIRRDLVAVEAVGIETDGRNVELQLNSRLAAGAEDYFDEVYPASTPFDPLEVRAIVTSSS